MVTILKEYYVRTEPNGVPVSAVDVAYATGDDLPTNYAFGIALCTSGDDKGKVKIFDGSSWNEQ